MSDTHKSYGRKWKPSNGTEGCEFADAFCNHCIHEKFMHTQNFADKQCDIFNLSFISGDYVDEWIIGENGMPTCTAHVRWDWDKDDDGNWNDPPEPMPYDPNQLVLPFAFEELENQTIKNTNYAVNS